MKISIITPLSESGNAYIGDVYTSLKAQTFTNWEWVVLQNNGGRAPMSLRGDKRVKLHRENDPNQGSMQSRGSIGWFKKRACALSTGEIIVELDHDDLLSPNALKKVAEAVEHGADFVYSDFAEFFDKTWVPNNMIDPLGIYGWKRYPIKYDGHKLIALKAPEVTPHNLRYVDWTPNHVRAWTRKAYDQIGGHDATFPVADDHDLVSRFYLAKMHMVYIPECLYFYRVHEKNNVKTQNGEIRSQTDRVYNKIIWALGERFADDGGFSKVDLCGGVDTQAGYTPLDLALGHDLDQDWDVPESSVGVLRAHDALEHLKNPIHTMNEAYRVLAPGGFFMVHVPSTNGLGAFCDPTHVSFWNKLSFRYYTDRQSQRYIPAFKGRFQMSRMIEWFPSEWHRENNVPYVEAHMFALKPGFEPMGEVLI